MNRMLLAAAFAALIFTAPARAETTLCNEITALPFTITTQGVYCLKKNIGVNLASGNAITVNAHHVTIDFNGFRVNNQAPQATNVARGVFAQNRKHISLRNGFIRGFYYGVFLLESSANASGSHLVEDMKVADSGYTGIWVAGDRSVVANNRVLNTGNGANTNAFGIVMWYADDSAVRGNLVSGVTETTAAFGVDIAFSNRVVISGNEVLGMNAPNAYGIATEVADRVSVIGNHLLNDPGTGDKGVNGSDANLSCLDNQFGGYTATPFADCDYANGNRVMFN